MYAVSFQKVKSILWQQIKAKQGRNRWVEELSENLPADRNWCHTKLDLVVFSWLTKVGAEDSVDQCILIDDEAVEKKAI